jgi:hypothetical protein
MIRILLFLSALACLPAPLASASYAGSEDVNFESVPFFNALQTTAIVTHNPGGHVDCSECSGPYNVPPSVVVAKEPSKQLACSSQSTLDGRCTIITDQFKEGYTGLNCKGYADYEISGTFTDPSGDIRQAIIAIKGAPEADFPAISLNETVSISCSEQGGRCEFKQHCSTTPTAK